LPQQTLPQQTLPQQSWPHQYLPHQYLPHQPLPHQPLPYHSWPHQPSPYSAQNTSLQSSQEAPAGFVLPWPPHTQQTNYEGSINPLGQPLQAPSYPHMPGQYFSEGRSQISNPAQRQLRTSGRGARPRSRNVYNHQSLANPWLPSYSPSASLPPNTGIPLQHDGLNPLESGFRGVGMNSSQPSHTGFLSQNGPAFQPFHPSQLPPAGTFQPQNVSLTADPWQWCQKDSQ
jgi:hypothetical protein